MKFNHAYMKNPPVCNHPGGGDLMTDQSFKRSCDINTILAKYKRGELVDHVNEHGGDYGDYVSAPEFHDAMNMITEATEMFEGLPADVRDYFRNDVSELLAAAADPERQDEMFELGLLPRDPSLPPAEPAPKAQEDPKGSAVEPKGETPAPKAEQAPSE